MTLFALLPLAASGLAGGLLVDFFLPGLPGGRAAALLRASAGMGLGLALSSTGTFLWLCVFGRLGHGLIATEVIVLIGLAALAWRRRARDSRTPGASWGRADRILCACFLLAAGSAGAAFVVRSLSQPHGFWDAWAIWNARARFLFRAGDEWRRAFSPDLAWSHTDYPLLLPGLVVRGWVYAGRETWYVPALIGLVYMLATVGLLVAALAILHGRTHALVAGTLLLSTPLFCLQGAAQCADVPIGLYFLGALSFLALEKAFPERARRFAVLSGALAGCSVWMKNEGTLFVVCLAAVRSVVAFRRGRARARLGPFLLGLLPAAILLAFFRGSIRASTDLLSEQTWGHVVATLRDPSRYLGVLAECARVVREEFVPVFVAAAVSVFLLGAFRRDRERSLAAGPAAVLGLLVAGYFIVYVTTPKPFAWHLATSLSRLAVQLWPSALFSLFLYVGRPRRGSPSTA